MLIPLSVIWATRPRCAVPETARIPELFSRDVPAADRNLWSTLFHGIDRGVKLLEKLPVKPSREVALARAER